MEMEQQAPLVYPATVVAVVGATAAVAPVIVRPLLTMEAMAATTQGGPATVSAVQAQPRRLLLRPEAVVVDRVTCDPMPAAADPPVPSGMLRTAQVALAVGVMVAAALKPVPVDQEERMVVAVVVVAQTSSALSMG